MRTRIRPKLRFLLHKVCKPLRKMGRENFTPHFHWTDVRANVAPARAMVNDPRMKRNSKKKHERDARAPSNPYVRQDELEPRPEVMY